VTASWTGRWACRETVRAGHSGKAPGVPCAAASHPEGRRGAKGPLVSDGGEECGVATWCGGSATVSAHVSSLPLQYAEVDFRGGGGERRIRVETGSARPDATPVMCSRHCSPVLLGSCPPPCLRYMGSARANRSGRSPGSEWKVFDVLGPLGAAAAEAATVVGWEGRRRVWKKWCPSCLVAVEI
jgi:hypothetical protein